MKIDIHLTDVSEFELSQVRKFISFLRSGKRIKESEDHDIAMKMPIEDLNFSRRVFNCLSNYTNYFDYEDIRKEPIKVVGDIVRAGKKGLRSQRNFGPTCLREVAHKLYHIGVIFELEQ